MCIICNAPDAGNSFVERFSWASRQMEIAAADMLAASKEARHPEVRRSYDRAYKNMRRLIRQWNKVEHSREAYPDTPAPPTEFQPVTVVQVEWPTNRKLWDDAVARAWTKQGDAGDA